MKAFFWTCVLPSPRNRHILVLKEFSDFKLRLATITFRLEDAPVYFALFMEMKNILAARQRLIDALLVDLERMSDERYHSMLRCEDIRTITNRVNAACHPTGGFYFVKPKTLSPEQITADTVSAGNVWGLPVMTIHEWGEWNKTNSKTAPLGVYGTSYYDSCNHYQVINDCVSKHMKEEVHKMNTVIDRILGLVV